MARSERPEFYICPVKKYTRSIQMYQEGRETMLDVTILLGGGGCLLAPRKIPEMETAFG
jgi:hypothetical protein